MKNPLSNEEYKERNIVRTEDIRGPYFRDQTAILHSMPFRRLKHKTQVFFAPGNDHICTRIEHVMHVATIAATICKGLNDKNPNFCFNGELAYAIGLGHDLGHAPFGHAGEEALSKKMNRPFMHELHSYRVANKLTNSGSGLNLTYGVLDGIISHNGERFEREIEPCCEIKDLDRICDRKLLPSSYEGCIVRMADKIAYLGRDIEDALLAKLIKEEDIPKAILEKSKIEKVEIKKCNGKIIDFLVCDIIKTTYENGKVGFSGIGFDLIKELRDFNYERIYKHPRLQKYKEHTTNIITTLYDYLQRIYSENGNQYELYKDSNNKLKNSFGNYLSKMESFYKTEAYIPSVIFCDYIAGMTDDFALTCMKEISLPKALEF